MHKSEPLPDVACSMLRKHAFPLKWVGMEGLAVPLTLEMETNPRHFSIARAAIYVGLSDTSARGIHMSRLHRILNQLDDAPCAKSTLDSLLDESVASQAGLSQSARIDLAFDLLLKRPALLSGEYGYQSYPVKIQAELVQSQRSYSIELTIPYSSTCPCSASLSRQLLATAVDATFADQKLDKASLLTWLQSEQGSVATPHAQRSYAYVKLITADNPWPDLSALIVELETVIGTPVQTAVKRVDEQDFARLNAENLMFCEDAARRIKGSLERMDAVAEYWLKVEHQESLHAHNAVVVDQKH